MHLLDSAPDNRLHALVTGRAQGLDALEERRQIIPSKRMLWFKCQLYGT